MKITVFDGSFLSRHLASAPSRKFRVPSTIYVGVTYIPISVLHDGYILKMKNSVPGFSPIFIKKNFNCWYFVKKKKTGRTFIQPHLRTGRITYQIEFISHFDGIVGEKIVPAICTHGSVRR